MKEILQQIIKLMAVMPTWAQIIGLLLIALILYFYKYILGNKEFQSALILKTKKLLYLASKKDLFSHDLFFKAEFYKRQVSDLLFKNEDLTFIFKTILYTKIDTTISRINEFIKNTDFKIDSVELSKLLLTEVDLIIKDYDARIKDVLIKKYKKGSEIFDYVMKSPQGFKVYHSDNVRHIISIIEIIAQSKIFDTNMERMIMYLHEIQNALKMAIWDAERAFYKFNGELEALLKEGENE